jgi:hypothetical protein
MTCEKKSPVIAGKPIAVEQDEPITDSPTFRNDLPLPPQGEWRNLDVSTLDTCRSILWKYLRNMYPIYDDNFWNYEIYSVIGEPEHDMMLGLRYQDRYGFFFRDTILRNGGASPPEGMTCAPIDSTFFYDAVGNPTCKSFNKGNKYTTFVYYVKNRWRSGPVPFIYEDNPENGQRCDIYHFDYASFLRCQFDWETGELMYIDWH